jgi:hypothetical protein
VYHISAILQRPLEGCRHNERFRKGGWRDENDTNCDHLDARSRQHKVREMKKKSRVTQNMDREMRDDDGTPGLIVSFR